MAASAWRRRAASGDDRIPDGGPTAASHGAAVGPNHRVDIGNAKAEVWSYDAWPNYGVYTVFVGQRTYFIEVHAGKLTTRQLAAMIAPWLR